MIMANTQTNKHEQLATCFNVRSHISTGGERKNDARLNRKRNKGDPEAWGANRTTSIENCVFWSFLCFCPHIVAHPGFIQTNPFTIHKLFTNICSMYMVQKSNTKVHNSFTHPIKGRNPYYSWWPMHSISHSITDRKCVPCDFAQPFFF